MSDCKKDWSKGKDCNGCWASIFSHLVLKPDEPILPQPAFCQDAAYVAFVLDGRLKIINEATSS